MKLIYILLLFLFTPVLNALDSNDKSSNQFKGPSVYELDSTWINQNGVNVNLEELRGKPYIVTMAFTGCRYSCPLIIEELKRIDRKFTAKQRAQYGIIFFSIDPTNDTPSVLRAYAKKSGIDLNRWIFMTSNDETVRDLAAAVGFKYKKDAKMGFSHSNLITVLDRNGSINFQQKAINQSRTDIINALKKLLAKKRIREN